MIQFVKNKESGSSNEIYSTEEVRTNKVWIDGKPIYRKVFEFTNLNANNTNFPHNIQNLDQIINAKGAFQRADGSKEILQRVDASHEWQVYIGDISNENILISIGTSYKNDFKIVRLHLILEYTKKEVNL